jgi:hypothetical protein
MIANRRRSLAAGGAGRDLDRRPADLEDRRFGLVRAGREAAQMAVIAALNRLSA